MGNSNAAERNFNRKLKYLSFNPRDFYDGRIKFKDMCKMLERSCGQENTLECMYDFLKNHDSTTIRHMSEYSVSKYERRSNNFSYSLSCISSESLDSNTE